ncbi:hypothetical protein GE21DRAFT_1336292 [Neurospora crassa]|nr:hypothetical protein GE21DRAFT_1336292 [Neurospora crassa]
MAPSRTYTTATDHDQCLSSVSRRRTNPHATTNGTNDTNGNPPPPSSSSSSSTSDLFTSSSPNDPFTTSSTTNGTTNGTSTLGGILVTTTTTTTTRNANSPLTPIPRGPVITGPSPSPLSLGSPALQQMSPTRSRGSSSDYARGSSRGRGYDSARSRARGRIMMNGNIRGARATPRGGYSTHNGSSLGSPPGSNGGDSGHHYNNYPLINHLYDSGSTHHGRSSRGMARGRGHGVFAYSGYAGFSDGSTNGVNGVHGSQGGHSSRGSRGSSNFVNGVNGVNNPNSSNGGRRPGETASERATAIAPQSYSIYTQRAMAAAAAAAAAGRGTGTGRGGPGPGPSNNVAPPRRFGRFT